MIVIGGTYDEYCFEPRWEQKYGSGLRGCHVIAKLNPEEEIEYYTFGDSTVEQQLSWLSGDIKIKPHITKIGQSIQFHYQYPLAVPSVFPRPDTIEKAKNSISVKGDKILYYGMMEGNAIVNGKKVVYDPQSPANPIAFSKTGSTAEQLAMVINLTEAKRLAGNTDGDIEVIKKFFFQEEKTSVLVLKMGPKGARVMDGKSIDEIIPVYETQTVWPIGSGDVFAASFANYWLNGTDPVTAAKNASWNTAEYCSTKSYNFTTALGSKPEIKSLSIKDFPKGQVYLAGPFFTFSQRWLIDQIFTSLLGMNLKVFSPWHHVGYGEASYVVPLDLKGLDESKVVFAVIDGLDSGTMIEVGYAISKGIPVIGYVQNETSDNTKMMQGTGCVLESDLTTAIYKTLWILAKNE